jgi:long-chain acyl-CoA synthetase
MTMNADATPTSVGLREARRSVAPALATTSFVAAILERARTLGARPALYEVHGERLVPERGRDLCAKVARARGFLRALGVQRGDRVALLGPNSASWAALDLAIIAERAICVPLYSRQEPRQLAGMLRDCKPSLLLAADDRLVDAITSAWGEHCPIARYDAAFSGDAVDDPVALEADDPVTIIYTSGTSGEPKGAVLNAGNVAYMLEVTVRELQRMSGSERSEDRVYHYLPFCFAGSRIMLWSQLRRGNPLMVGTDLARLQQELHAAAPHYSLNVPALLERIRNGVREKLRATGGPVFALYERAVTAHGARARGETLNVVARAALALGERALFPRIKRQIGANLEFLACGSAPLSEQTQRWFQMIGIPVYQVYGLTETTAIVTIDDTDRVVPGRVGRAVAGCELKLGDDFELLCRGPNVFAGYYGRPADTAAVLRDGWFHTGDQAELDARGNVKIIGRLKEVLVPESGHNVAPEPIEQRLCEASAAIEQALVLGHGRPYLVAIVTGRIDDAELARVQELVNAQLPHYQRLRKLWRAPEPFTAEKRLLTANQKLRRKAIESFYSDAIERMYR